MTHPTGGPAFPQSTTIGAVSETVGGMTLRDWFAGQALSGLLSSDGSTSWERYAASAYKAADAMIQARGTE